jgi:hypothetical protein
MVIVIRIKKMTQQTSIVINKNRSTICFLEGLLVGAKRLKNNVCIGIVLILMVSARTNC